MIELSKLFSESQLLPDEITASSISFSDPREQAEKEYELPLRAKLPKSVSKCQGKCGKPIKKDDVLVVKSYGKISWTDKNTGQERQKFGPMYIHFKEDCLKTFSDKVYAPGESFDFGKIKIDSKSRNEVTKTDMDFFSRTRN